MFQPSSDRLPLLMAAGNLGTTEVILNRIRRDLAEASCPLGPDAQSPAPHLNTNRHLFEAADHIGQLSLATQRQLATSLREEGDIGETGLIHSSQITG